MKKLLLLVCCLGLLGSACDEDPIEVNGLVVEAAGVLPTPPDAATDSVLVIVAIRNVSGSPITLSGGREHSYDLIVRDENGAEIWRRLSGAVRATAIPITIAPGQSDTWTASWDLADAKGDRVDSGEYSVYALFGNDLNNPILEAEALSVIVQ